MFEDTLGGCRASEAELTIQRPVAASPTQTWTVEVGMCPSFRTHDPEYQSRQRARVVYVAIIVAGTVVCLAAVGCLAYFTQRELALQVTLAKQVRCPGRRRTHTWCPVRGVWCVCVFVCAGCA